MKLFIPACGDRIVLAEPWNFDLYLERRNWKFAEARKLIKAPLTWDFAHILDGNGRYTGVRKLEIELPPGTILECCRVYIRSFSKSALKVDNDYDSITWKVISEKGKALTGQRFWAKLSQCNGIDFSLQPDSIYRDRVKLIKEVMTS